MITLPLNTARIPKDQSVYMALIDVVIFVASVMSGGLLAATYFY